MNSPVKASEHSEQTDFFNWLHWTRLRDYPEIHPLFFAVPNGSVLAGDARRRGIQMNRLKGEGLTPGVADTLFLSGRGGYFGLALEFKTADREGSKNGGLSESQQEFMNAVKAEGFAAEVAYGADHAEVIAERYLGQPKTQELIYKALKHLEAGRPDEALSILRDVVRVW